MECVAVNKEEEKEQGKNHRMRRKDKMNIGKKSKRHERKRKEAVRMKRNK